MVTFQETRNKINEKMNSLKKHLFDKNLKNESKLADLEL